MPLYRAKFERFNFLISPPGEQKVDVFFVYEGDEDDLEAMEEACWAALHEQFPMKEGAGMPEGYGGWSSWLGGRKIERVDIDKDLGDYLDLGTPGEGKPRIAEVVTYKSHNKKEKGRVDSFYKYWVRPQSDDPGDEMTRDILRELEEKEYERMTEDQRRWKDLEFKAIACSREEADFVGVAGVAWTYVRIEDVKVTGLIQWDKRSIAKERQRWDQNLERRKDESPTTFHKYWEI